MATAKQLAALKKARAARMKKAGTKGAPSKTMPGRLDFTTKSTSKDFHRGGRLEQTAMGSNVRRRPFATNKMGSMRKGMFAKGSQEAKDYMAKIRGMKRK